MGIYINGMEMPSSGCIKMLIILGNGHVIETTPGCDPQPGAQNYAAVPIPPHGDLVDREVLMDDIIGSMVFSGRKVPKEAAIVQKVLDIVGDANAIIPASGGQEDE